MRINPFVYGILVLTVFLGIIFGFQAAGIWSVSGKVTASGEAVQPEAEDVSTIKGWMTLDQIINVYNVPLEELVAAFDLPAGTTAATALKDLESETFSVTGLRDWLETRTPASPEGVADPSTPDTPTPQPVEPTPDVTPVIEQVEPAAPAETALPTDHVPVAGTVTGKTTFQDLLDWGVPQGTIESIIGGPLPGASTVVKDYINAQGMDFATVKDTLQAEVP